MRLKLKIWLIQLLIPGLIGSGLLSGAVLATSASFKIPPDHYIFHSLRSDSGKVLSDVTKVYQDSRGYIWLGTLYGLFRYDGYSIENYTEHQHNNFRLSIEFIYDITEDMFGNLWIATRYGFYKFNFRTGKISRHFSSSITATPNSGKGSVSDNRIPKLLLDDKRLLIGTAKGLDVIDLDTEVISPLLKGYHVRSLYKDESGLIWIGTAENGLLQYDETSSSVKQFPITGIYGDDYNFVRVIVSLNNDLLIGTDDGLLQFDTRQKIFKQALLKGTRIRDIVIGPEDTVWIATGMRGLHRYSIEEKILKQIIISTTGDKNLINTSIYSLLMDQAHSRLWVVGQTGAYFLELSKPTYLIRRQLPSKDVWSISGNESNDLLIGTQRGLSVYNAEHATISHHYEMGAVHSIAIDNTKAWLASDNGLFEFDNTNNKLIDHTPKISLVANRSRKYIRDVRKKGEYELLIALESGLILWDQRTQHSINYAVNNPSAYSDLANSFTVIYHHYSTLFVGTEYGLYFTDVKGKSLQRYLHNKALTVLDKAIVQSISSDSHDNLWVGTTDGIFKLKDRKIIAHYDKAKGVPSAFIHSIVIDEDRLWVSTNDGLAAFHIDGEKFEKIYLNNESFNLEFNSCISSQPDGQHLYFCSSEGVFYFNPKSFAHSAVPPKTMITGFRLFNQPQVPGSKWLPQSIEYTDRLILDYQQNMLSFEFSALNYSQAKHLYAYQMLGITKEDEWIITDSQNRMATFTAQNPGDYTFRIKAGWDEKTWSDEITQLKVTILPPWWQSTTAYGFYLFAFLMSIILIIKVRTGRLHKQAMVLKQEVAERTEEIQGLLEKKNELFANVSHELRTPLTLILGPADKGLHSDSSEEMKTSFRLIKRSGLRLRALVEQLLLFSKLSHFELLEAKPCSVRKTTQVIGASMASLMDENQLALEMDSIPDVWVKLSPEDALQTILINLLSNAVKYTPAGGKIKISVNIIDEAQVRIMIADSGPGIPEEWFDKIFERFSRLPQHAKSNISGTGLGLPMVKDLVEMNGGYIQVSSVEEAGTVFTVVLPGYEPKLEEKESELIMSLNSFEQISKDSLGLLTGSWKISEQDAGKPTLVVIDDTIDMLAYLASEFSYEFNVLLAEDGELGMQLIRQHGPDLVICDVMMPGIDGFEVLKQLRSDINISHIPLILLTAKEGKESRIKGYQERADDYIVKPFEMSELKARVNNILDLRELWQQQAQSALSGSQNKPHELIQNYADTEKRFLEKFKAILDEHYQDPNLDLEILCDQMHLSQSSLNRKIKALLGSSPYQYLRVYRLQKAAQILKSGYQGNIGQLANAMGFSTQQHFTKCFKDYFGMVPKDYKGKS